MLQQSLAQDSSFYGLDSIYYEYQLVTDTTFAESLFVPIIPEQLPAKGELIISGAKDFVFDINEGFDQGLKVDLTGEVEGVKVEGNLSDQAVPSSTIPISDVEKVSLKVSTRNVYGSLGNLTVNLPFDIEDEILGGRIGMHSVDEKKGANLSYAVSRGLFKRQQFIGEEGRQSPYFLDGSVIPGSERVYLTQGVAMPRVLAREKDYNIEYETGIISFTNANIITNYSRIEVEYQQAIEDYQNIYQTADGKVDVAGFVFQGLFRQKYDEKENPLTFTLSPVEIESLGVSGDSEVVLHTYADTSSQGSYVIEGNHFMFVGEGNGDYNVTFFYVGEAGGEYIYDPNIKGFSYQGPGLGNYSPTKLVPLPQQNDFYALGVDFQEIVKAEVYGSLFDQNTFSPDDDNDNSGKGGRVSVSKAVGFLSLNGEYINYEKTLQLPTSKQAIDYQYQWNSDEDLEEMGNVMLKVAPKEYLKADLGYGLLNREHRRRLFNFEPWFFQVGYQGIDSLDRYYAGLEKRVGSIALFGRYENFENSQVYQYDVKYMMKGDRYVGLSGSYDRDHAHRGITTIFHLKTSPLSLALGSRLYGDTTFLFGNAGLNILYENLSLVGNLEQNQRYVQKRDESYVKVDEGEGNYVYDSITGTYVESEAGDYVRRIYLLEEFERVIVRNYNLEAKYAYSVFDVRGGFNYLDEEKYLHHAEDLIFSVGDENYNLEFNLSQTISEDARYALYATASQERLFSFIPSYKKTFGRVELKQETENYGMIQAEKRDAYEGEIAHSLFQKPTLTPKIGYSYSKIFSQYFENLDLRLQIPRFHLLIGLPIMDNQGRIEPTAELIYRIYNIVDVPYFFAASEPPGLTTILGTVASLSIGANTIFSLVYRIEFPPQEDIRQTLRFQTRIRF